MSDVVNPGVPFSTTSNEMPCAPASPVRTAVTTKSARTPEVMYVFAPNASGGAAAFDLSEIHPELVGHAPRDRRGVRHDRRFRRAPGR